MPVSQKTPSCLNGRKLWKVAFRFADCIATSYTTVLDDSFGFVAGRGYGSILASHTATPLTPLRRVCIAQSDLVKDPAFHEQTVPLFAPSSRMSLATLTAKRKASSWYRAGRYRVHS